MDTGKKSKRREKVIVTLRVRAVRSGRTVFSLRMYFLAISLATRGKPAGVTGCYTATVITVVVVAAAVSRCDKKKKKKNRSTSNVNSISRQHFPRVRVYRPRSPPRALRLWSRHRRESPPPGVTYLLLFCLPKTWRRPPEPNSPARRIISA